MCETHGDNNIAEKIIIHRKRNIYISDKTVKTCVQLEQLLVYIYMARKRRKAK
jgi:hypothetical protein